MPTKHKLPIVEKADGDTITTPQGLWDATKHDPQEDSDLYCGNCPALIWPGFSPLSAQKFHSSRTGRTLAKCDLCGKYNLLSTHGHSRRTDLP